MITSTNADHITLATSNWSSYEAENLQVLDRIIYAFEDEPSGLVKIGLVTSAPRVEARRREVESKLRKRGCTAVGVRTLATVVVPGFTYQGAEHVEAVVRHWLVQAMGFEHAGIVDWLRPPAALKTDWIDVLDAALRYALVVLRYEPTKG